MFRRPAVRPRGVGLALLALVIMVIPITGATAPPTSPVIVVLEDSSAAPPVMASDVASAFGGRVTKVYQHAIRGFAIELPAPALVGLARAPGVAWVEPDITVSIDQSGAQPLPTHLDRIEHDLNPTAGPVPVNIAILDTGVQLDHPDLNVRAATDCTGAIFYPLFGGCTGSSGNLGDQNGHGTYVAGLAAACDNDIGTIGSAPCAQITSVKVLDATGSGPLSGILAGLDTVAANASWIDVANASWGFEGGSQALTDSVNGVVAAGVAFVTAAGNLSQEISTYSPANVPDAITVTAVTDFDGKAGGLGAATCRPYVDDTLAEFSNFGAGADIAAPGVCLYSSWLDSGYATASGTSAASPVVAGAVARYIAENTKPTSRAGVLAIRDALVNGGFPQNEACGFTDVDGIPEPLLSLNGSAFGGPGDCETGTSENQPPVAAFTYECVGLDCTFDGTTSSDDVGIDSYAWLFGDGSEATGPTAAHTYAASADYSVTLTVTDGEGLSDSDTQTITVDPPNQPPTAAFTYECVDLDCTFDGTTSSDDAGIDSYAWSFGDGSEATGPTAAHTYVASADYSVTLTVTDGEGLSDTDTRTVTVDPPNQPPTAAFTFDCPELNCTFDSSGSSDGDGTIVGWQWTFGDGAGSDQANPAHSYVLSGTYDVTLVVTDDDGAQSLPGTVTVTVPNGTPTAAFDLSCTELTCSFDASASSDDGGIVSYEWAFGDGTGATGQTASHTYAAAGDYLVTLTVTDGEGAQASASQTATAVEAGPIEMTTANIGYLWDPVTREATMLLSIWENDDVLAPVSEATVIGYWNWENKGGKLTTMDVSAFSDSLGFAEIVTVFKKNQTPVQFCVVDIVKDGYEYVPSGPACAREF